MKRSEQVRKVLDEVNATEESPRETAEHVARHLETERERTLRSVAFYGERGFEVLYARLDLQPREVEDRLGRAFAQVRSDFGDAAASPFARQRSSVYRFDEGVLVHLPQEDDRGVIAEFEPDTAGLDPLVVDCLAKL